METKDVLKNFTIQEIDNKSQENFASFAFTKLPNDFAVTLGNFLRRVLLSYVKGIAIMGVKVGNGKEFIKSEFVPLEGLLETPPYLIMNLKNLVLAFKEGFVADETIKLSIDITNDSEEEYKVTGADVTDANNGVEVLNPTVYIATVSPKSSLHIEMHCKSAWGFKKAGDQKELELEENLIIIDTNYNPVKSVAFKVNPVVIDLDQQEEQLILDIKTDGSVSPKQSLINSLEISKNISESLLKCFEIE